MKLTCPSTSPSPQAQPGQQQSAAPHPSSPATDRLSGSNQEIVRLSPLYRFPAIL